MLTDLAIDTAESTLCDQNNDRKNDFCVIAGASVTLPASRTIKAFGPKPLVLLSTLGMILQGNSIIDVSSHSIANPQATGAGANPASCINGNAAALAGGGYGGSFGGQGGDGERLTGSPATSGVAAPQLVAPPTLPLRGGCPGGTGDSSGGLGGNGGGAVALIAFASIQLDGKINASGAGGHGGPATKSGGGGGGSGGMIVLDSPSIQATGPLFANGGGGGQGGTGGASALAGDDGGESLAPPTPAPGGNNTTGREGGSAGGGSAGNRLGGTNAGNTPATTNGGGGGGGGGAGFIRAPGVSTNIAPPSFVP